MSIEETVVLSIGLCTAFAEASIRLHGPDGADLTYPEYQAAVRYLNAQPGRIDRIPSMDRFAERWLRRAANPLPEQPVRPCDW